MSQSDKNTETSKLQGFDLFISLLNKRVTQVKTLISVSSTLAILIFTNYGKIQPKIRDFVMNVSAITPKTADDTCLVLNPPEIPPTTFPVSMLGKKAIKLSGVNNCSGPRKVYFALVHDYTKSPGSSLLEVEAPLLNSENNCGKANIHNHDCWLPFIAKVGPWTWEIVPPISQIGSPTRDHPLEISTSWWIYKYTNDDVENDFIFTGSTRFIVTSE